MKCSFACIFSFSRLHSPFPRSRSSAKHEKVDLNVSNVIELFASWKSCHKHAQWVESIDEANEKSVENVLLHCFAFSSSVWFTSVRSISIFYVQIFCEAFCFCRIENTKNPRSSSNLFTVCDLIRVFPAILWSTNAKWIK